LCVVFGEHLFVPITTAKPLEKLFRWVVVATFKNESIILPEWVQHYINEGTDHLYLIDNGSEDEYMTSLIRFPQQQMITVVRDSSPPQMTLQDKLMKKYITPLITEDADWVLVVDIDEYVYPVEASLCIVNVLDSYPDSVGRVWLPWKVFGSNGHLTQPPEGIVAGFTKRKSVDHYLGQHALGYGKSFTRVRGHGLELLTHHGGNGDPHIHYSDGTKLEYGDHLAKVKLDEEITSHQSLQLNHYMFQSRDYYQRIKCERGGGQSGRVAKYTMEFFDKHEPQANAIEDLGLKQRNDLLGKKCLSKFATRGSIF